MTEARCDICDRDFVTHTRARTCPECAEPKPGITKKYKVQLKAELRSAVESGVRQMLDTTRGAQFFGSRVQVRPYEKLLEIKIPGANGPTYFEIIVKERF